MAIPLTLDDKVALITGGSRGIGAAAVRMFVAAGARVAFNYQKAKDQAEQLVQERGADRCFAVASDLSSIQSARELVGAAVHHFGRLDILVANHGVWPPEDAPVERMTEEQWKFTVSINLDSVFGLVKHSVAQMKAQPRGGNAAGHVVLVSSDRGPARGSLPLRLRGNEGRTHQHGEGTFHRTGNGGHLRELRSAGMGRDRHVRTRVE